MREVIKIACVYQIMSKTTGRIYVGSTKQFNLRRSSHLTKLRRSVHVNKNLQLNVNQYGLNDLEFSVLERVYDVNFLVEREQYYMDLLKPALNINLTAGNVKAKNSPEVVSLIANKLRGRRMSEEVKLKISAANTGKTRTEAQRAYMRLMNRKMSEEGLTAFRQKVVGKISKKRKRVMCVETGMIYDHAGLVAAEYGCTTAAICMVCNGQSKTAKGFRFSYA